MLGSCYVYLNDIFPSSSFYRIVALWSPIFIYVFVFARANGILACCLLSLPDLMAVCGNVSSGKYDNNNNKNNAEYQTEKKLKRINGPAFPVQYDDSFYQDIIKRSNENLNKFAIHKGRVVGAICSRIEEKKCGGRSSSDSDDSDDNGRIGGDGKEEGRKRGGSPGRTKRRLYIMTLAVLAPYRGRGIGSQLLRSTLDCFERRNLYVVDEIALHVQICNEDAMRFYTERFGFTKGEMVKNYYRRVNPPHCYLLYKKMIRNTKKKNAGPVIERLQEDGAVAKDKQDISLKTEKE